MKGCGEGVFFLMQTHASGVIASIGLLGAMIVVYVRLIPI